MIMEGGGGRGGGGVTFSGQAQVLHQQATQAKLHSLKLLSCLIQR